MSLFKDFEKYFGFSEILKIETTYRFFDPLIKLSSNFYSKKFFSKVRKNCKVIKRVKNTHFHFKYSKNQDDTLALQDILQNLLENNKLNENKKVFYFGKI